ncbi:MAG: thiamine pyrophosphate-dependent dehydrogenase E1 component subunit alpha, partial [Anaerolineales bacterium]
MSRTQNAEPDRTKLLSMLAMMYRIRLFEEALYHAFMTEKMPGTMHQAIGMEAIPSGVGHCLVNGDKMTSTHRGHGHAIAMGVPTNELMAELYAKKTGSSGGMGGSLHIFDVQHGFLGTTGVVGAGIPIATGAGLAAKFNEEHQVVAAFFGDGAANQGAVHEGLNLAAVWNLPIVFICENNQYAVSFSVDDAFAIENIADRAATYG